MRKRLFFALLLLLILAACAQNDTPEVFETDFAAIGGESEVIDLGGMEFIFGTGWYNYYYENDQQTLAGDMMRKRYNDVMEAYNCVYTVTTAEDSSAPLLATVAAGMRTYDVLDIHGHSIYSAYKARLLYRMEDIATIDSNDVKWGPVNFRQYGMFDGYTYGFFPWHWAVVGEPQFEGSLLFNGELIKKANLVVPYELQERGEWNWSTYETYLRDCKNAYPEFVPLIINRMDFFGQSVMMSNGAEMIKQNDSGEFYFGFNSEEAYKALDYIASLGEQGLMKTGGIEPFTVDCSCVFYASETHHGTANTPGANYAPGMLNDFGMISFPYGPDADASTVSAYVHYQRRLNWVLNTSGNDPDDMGIVLDYVFAPLDDMGEAAWKNFLENYVFVYPESYENFIDMLDGVKYNYSAQLQSVWNSYSSAILSACNGTRTAAEAISSISESMNAAIAENVEWIYSPDFAN